MPALRGRGSLSIADKGGGVFQMRTSAFLVQKTSDFSKCMVCPHGQGGLRQCKHFSDKGDGRFNFSRFSAGVLYGRLQVKMQS